MSLEIKGQMCPICKAYLFEEDDIAVCPTCGAPHHRECFINAGKCGMEEFHGTDKQYDIIKKASEEKDEAKEQEAPSKEETVKCRNCNNEYPATNSFCPQCGTPKAQSGPVVIQFDYLGGVKADEDLGEGHKADEVKNFVVASTNRFIPKFKEFKNGRKVSFSVWHLLLPSASFALRKMYAFAAIAGAIEVAATLLMTPFNFNLDSIIAETGITGYMGLAQYMMDNFSDKALLSNFILACVGILLWVFVHLMSGLFANKLYYKHVIKTMTEINSSTEDQAEKLLLYRKRGGVNLFAFALVFMAVTYWLPSIIYVLI